MHNTAVLKTELHPFGLGLGAIRTDLLRLRVLPTLSHHGLHLEVVRLREGGVCEEVVQVLSCGPDMIKLSLRIAN